jgi:hypothetical protein
MPTASVRITPNTSASKRSTSGMKTPKRAGPAPSAPTSAAASTSHRLCGTREEASPARHSCSTAVCPAAPKMATARPPAAPPPPSSERGAAGAAAASARPPPPSFSTRNSAMALTEG